MTHIDEHTLELYVLNAREVENRREEIRQHVAVCAGCRALVENMTEFHAELAQEMENKEITPVNEHALIRRHGGMTPYTEPFGPPARYIPSTPVQRMRYFIRRHPVAATAGSFGMAVALVALGYLFVPKPNNNVYAIADMNPAYARVNAANLMFEVNNKEHETLWRRPVRDGQTIIGEVEQDNFQPYQIVDLDKDGENEVVTTLYFQDAPNDIVRSLQIFKGDKTLVRSFIPDEHPVYQGHLYQAPYNCYGVVADTIQGGQIELFTLGGNGRSPAFIARLDAQGKIIGEYWHYGLINTIYLMDVDGDGKKEMIACGVNDVGDDKDLGKPTIIVLDPLRIIGKKEASTTRGFGLPVSDAELYSIRLPLSEINHAVGNNAVVRSMRTGANTLRFFSSTDVKGEKYEFEYIFDHLLHAEDVKSTTRTLILNSELRQNHRVSYNIDDAYLRNLKTGVRYWDGNVWRIEVARVGR
jgi:hypothetical protein